MVVFPNAKINIGLRIVKRRNDGYHELETVFYPLPFTDALEIIRSPVNGTTQFYSSGLTIAGDQADNLCIKAYNLLKRDYAQLPSVKIHLHKAIPSGAGLGGGSADASFTLKTLNTLGGLNLTVEQLLDYSLQLGSDCPFFIINKPAYATGRGEQLEPISLDLSVYGFVIVNPGIHVPTGAAFSWLTPAKPDVSLKELINLPITEWKGRITNDFEEAVGMRYPQIIEIKNQLYTAGAVYAAMSGSGSTVYGIFPAGEKPSLSFHPDYLVKVTGFR